MKNLIRRLSRVGDSSQYSLLRADAPPSRSRRFESFRAMKLRSGSAGVPVYVGEEMERFVVSAALLHHPVFVHLLNRSAQEYGYEQKGVLRIPCHVIVFERVLEAVRSGAVSCDSDLLDSLSDDFL